MDRKRARRGIWLAAALLLLAGCMETAFYRPSFGPVGEKHRPVLEAVWAQPEIGFDYLWRIYVRATDPDGDLDKVWINFSRFGGTYAPNFLILPPNQRNGANGYVQVWVRLEGSGLFTNLYGMAEIHVEDRAGNMSGARGFQFTVLGDPIKDEGNPPPGFAKDVLLGEMPFPIEMDTEGDDDDRDGGEGGG